MVESITAISFIRHVKRSTVALSSVWSTTFQSVIVNSMHLMPCVLPPDESQMCEIC